MDLERGVINAQRSLHWRSYKGGDWYFRRAKELRVADAVSQRCAARSKVHSGGTAFQRFSSLSLKTLETFSARVVITYRTAANEVRHERKWISPKGIRHSHFTIALGSNEESWRVASNDYQAIKEKVHEIYDEPQDSKRSSSLCCRVLTIRDATRGSRANTGNK